MPSVTTVWLEKHKRFWMWARECFFSCEKCYYSQILFHYSKWTQVQPHKLGLWVEFVSPIFQAWFLLQQDQAASLLKMTATNEVFNFVFWFSKFLDELNSYFLLQSTGLFLENFILDIGVEVGSAGMGQGMVWNDLSWFLCKLLIPKPES